ncbi:hypothetical protein Gpo141_00004438 [Globisporangium polare]
MKFALSSSDASDSPTGGGAATPMHAISAADSLQPRSRDIPDASVINARSSSMTAAAATTTTSAQNKKQSDEAAVKLQLQLERIESSTQLLSVDTVKVVQQAKKFLKQHQKAQISSSARTQLVARVGDESYAAHARERFESHSFAMKEAVVFQSSQKLRINETRERLQTLNISLPVPREQKKRMPLQPTKAQLLQLHQIQRQQKEFNGKIVSLVVDTAKEAVVEQEEQRQRADAKFLLDSLRQLEKEVEARNKRRKSKNGGAFFFYAFVMCLTGGYLWTAAVERKRRAPVQRERPWSPIPTFMIQIKDLFKSIVVIEDLRKQNELLADASDVEDDLGSLMVRTFVPQTPKLISKSSIPSSSRKL